MTDTDVAAGALLGLTRHRPPRARRDAARSHQQAPSRHPRIRPGSRPSAARAAAAARLVAGAGSAGAAASGQSSSQPIGPDRQRPLRVVEPVKLTPAQRRRRARALLLAAATLFVVVAFGLVYFHVVLAQRQFALNRLDTSVQNERATYERLRLQVAELGSPQHIISTAVGQLGMRQPASVNYLTPTPASASAAAAYNDPPSGLAAGVAPAGDADWPLIKSQLAGSP